MAMAMMKMSINSNSAIVSALKLLSFACFLVLASSAAADVRALLEFKKGIKNDPLNKVLGTWSHLSVPAESDLGACPSSFYGVSCDASSNSVVSIVLDGLGLGGELKLFTLTGLKGLRKLSLSGNSFTGRLVPALGSMSTLEHLDLSDNKFYGPIPSRLHDLYGLNHLNLSLNEFEGWYPSGIRNLNQLRVFDLHSNRLSGNVKDFFAELQNAEYIDMSRNSFSGGLPMSAENVSGLGNTLQYLNLSYNKLDGGFPSADTLALFRNLHFLDLGGNFIAGGLPSFVSLSNLKVLRLSGNQLSGTVPEELLTSLIPLQELDLSVNGFSGSLAGFNSSTLQLVNISSNALKGSLPSSMGGCLVVDFSSNMISGDISVLKNWGSALRVLDLSSNMLNGSLPELGLKFQGLTFLRISNNSLAGNLPLEWNSFSTLMNVDLSANEFVGSIPPSLFSSANLVTLNLSGNHLSGGIPLAGSNSHELLALASSPMEFLDLSGNLLAGRLPPEIGSISELKLLNLANNNMSGQIPNDLGKLGKMVSLDLSGNGFEGRLPDNLPTALSNFNVSYNNLSGPVPVNLRKFPPSSFCPGNVLLQIPDAGRLPLLLPQSGRRHSSKASIIVAVVLGSLGAVFIIALVLLAYYRAQHHAFNDGEPSDRAVRVVRFNQPSVFKSRGSTEPATNTLSFSQDHLLTSNSGSLSRQAELATEIVKHMSAEGISSGSPMATSSCHEGSEQPLTVDMCSLDRLIGELIILDSSLSFTVQELSCAPAEILGRSSYGTLYKAALENHRMLTVKWLRVGLGKNKKEFAKEVKKLGPLRHPNIVPIRAYFCGPREQERLILADYIHGDNLAVHLHDTSPRRYSLLTFSQRLRVAVDVARCLQFLHDNGIPHGNLKPTNILLAASDLSAHVTDYGLHRLMTPAGIAEQILNLKPFGYCSPELATAVKPTPSLMADVYAFGVILMEMLTRRSAGDIISGLSGQVDLTDWVRICDQERRRRDCIDQDLSGGEEPSKATDDLLALSLKCIRPVNERPNIRQVFKELSHIPA